MSRLWKIEAAVAAGLFIAAFAVASWYVPQFVAAGGKPWFYQQEFGPAVMEACGFTVTRNPSEMGKLLKALL